MELKQVSTGIDGLDEVLLGGFPKGRSYLIAGEPGTGKTTLALQYLLDGVKKGEHCLYITIDEKPEQIIQSAQSLGWNLDRHLASGLLSFLDVTAYFGSRRILTSHFNFDHIIHNILQLVVDKKVDRLALDPITPLIFSMQGHTDISYFTRKMIFKLEEVASCTSVLTSPIPVGSDKLSIHGMVEYLASGILHLSTQKRNMKYIRNMHVKKMRGVPVEVGDYNFEIMSERGIIIRQPM